MPADLPLHLVIVQVVLHTPVWVWGVLAGITALGVVQLRDRTLGLRHLVLAPLGFAVYSLTATASSFGVQPQVLLAWLAGAGLSVMVGGMAAARPVPGAAEPERYFVAGSVWPLLVMWSVFAARYVTAVMLVLHPGVARGTSFALVMSLAYGALSGVFLARALRTVRSAAPALSVQPA